CLFSRLDRLKRLHPFYKNESAPEIAIRIAEESVTLARRNDREGTARDVVSPLLFQFPAEMSGDTHDVVHNSVRFFKDVLVDLLMNVTDRCPALVVGGGIGFVDMAYLAGLGVKNFAIDLELFRDV